MIGVDASVILDLVLAQSTAETIGQRLFAPTETLHAPELLDLEVLQVLRRHWRAGSLSVSRGEIAVADLDDLPVIRHPHGEMVERIWQPRERDRLRRRLSGARRGAGRPARHPGREAGPRAGSCRARGARVTSDPASPVPDPTLSQRTFTNGHIIESAPEEQIS